MHNDNERFADIYRELENKLIELSEDYDPRDAILAAIVAGVAHAFANAPSLEESRAVVGEGINKGMDLARAVRKDRGRGV